MRASRLLELLVLLQLRGGASAPDLATTLGVSVRTIYRDVEALLVAGVPIHTATGRNGGIRIDPSYRIAGLPRLEPGEARSVLFAAVPAIAEQLGLDTAAAERTLLPAMEVAAESAARSVSDHLLVEPADWFTPPDATPTLPDIARAVWDSREIRITYRGRDSVTQPLGLILKGDTWYLLGRRDAAERLYRVSRIESVSVLAHRFERPPEFDLPTAWKARREAFLDAIPEYFATVRVAPAAEPLLALLQEGTPELPLDPAIPRDTEGWARLRLRFERPQRAARLLLQLGPEIEVLDPPELRTLIADSAERLVALYRTPSPPPPSATGPPKPVPSPPSGRGRSTGKVGRRRSCA